MDDTSFKPFKILIILVKHERTNNTLIFHPDKIDDPLLQILCQDVVSGQLVDKFDYVELVQISEDIIIWLFI
jgi:hypothetical protein